MLISLILLGILAFLVGVFFGFCVMEQNFLSKAKKILQIAPNAKLVSEPIIVGICAVLNVLFDRKLNKEVELAILKNSILKNKQSDENLIPFEKNCFGGEKL